MQSQYWNYDIAQTADLMEFSKFEKGNSMVSITRSMVSLVIHSSYRFHFLIITIQVTLKLSIYQVLIM